MLKKKPIIGLIGRPENTSDNDKVICIWENSRRGIVKKGGIPILLLPNQDVEYETIFPKDVARLTMEEKKDLKQTIDLCDGIVIPGGSKIYEYDEFIYKYALDKNMPILGICAGMQLIGRVNNEDKGIKNTLVQNETVINHCNRDMEYVHNVNIVSDTLLHDILKSSFIKVNSKHNYHLTQANDLIISAYSEDGIIEAIEYPNKRFVIGIQWHPESILNIDENSNKIFSRFILECIEYSKITK